LRGGLTTLLLSSQTKIKIGPATVATLKMKEQIGYLTMLAVTNTVFQNHQHREEFLS